MHSYIKTEDGYVVGLWLVSGDGRGCAFSRLFDVGDFNSAARAVNMLNGGTLITIKMSKEY